MGTIVTAYKPDGLNVIVTQPNAYAKVEVWMKIEDVRHILSGISPYSPVIVGRLAGSISGLNEIRARATDALGIESQMYLSIQKAVQEAIQETAIDTKLRFHEVVSNGGFNLDEDGIQ